MKAFKAYDIRGIYGVDFNREDVYKIGFFLPALLDSGKVLVGRDVRSSSPEIFEALAAGINDAGADVYDIGLTTTPMVYWATAQYHFNASVQITASHNPKEYNGLKISRSDALPVGYDTGLSQLEKMIKSEAIQKSAVTGNCIRFDIHADYLGFQRSHLKDYSNLKIAIDCSNGMAGLFIKELMGTSPIYLYEELDGTFPNHDGNPLKPENIVDLQKTVLDHQCDVGVIFDGDADRVMFVDEKGQFISPDLMIAVLGHHFQSEKAAVCLQDIRSSKAVGEYLRPMGFQMETWRVGRAFAALKLREVEGLFGGELAGHYYFRDFYYSDSGLMACSLILGVISQFKESGIPLSQLIAQISTYANSGEINFKIDEKQAAMDAVRKHFVEEEQPLALFDFDGYRLEFADWWFNIRPSNTEPYLRFLAEAKDATLLSIKIETVKSILSRFQ